MSTMAANRESTFEDDVRAYLSALPKLLGESNGQFALVGMAALAGVFVSQSEAMAAGYSRFGLRGFLVQEISGRDLEMGTHWHQTCQS